MSQAPITARATEEGRIQHHDHAFTAQDGQLQQQQQKHKRGWLHHRKDQRKKEKIESKLPGVMADTKDAKQAERRLKIKNEIVAAVGEFVGTFLFLFFSFGIATVAGQQSLTAQSAGQVQSTGGDSTGTTLDPSQLLYSSLGFGFSLAVNAWLFFRVSGGLFNPAVAFGLLLTGSLSLVRFPILVVMEVAGALSAAGLAQVLVPGGIQARARLAGSTTIAQGFWIEAIMTTQLILAVFLLAGEKHKGTFLAPVGIGLSLFIAELWATPFTSGALNPVRALGPDVVAHRFETTTWIYYVSPFVGAMIAAVIYSFLRYARYTTAVEGQDGDDVQMVMKDASGNVTGAIDRVAAPEAQEEGLVRTASRESVATVDGDGTTAGGDRSPGWTDPIAKNGPMHP